MEEGPVKERNAQASTDPREFQAYDASKVNDRVKQAVKNTRGQIILRRETNNRLVSCSSGGKTPVPSKGWASRKRTPPTLKLLPMFSRNRFMFGQPPFLQVKYLMQQDQ